jgi:hypothetical protein
LEGTPRECGATTTERRIEELGEFVDGAKAIIVVHAAILEADPVA